MSTSDLENSLIDLVQQNGFCYSADFGADLPKWTLDEPAPVGTGTGPSPEQVLATAAAYCLSASLTFALGKFREDSGTIRTHAEAVPVRNDQGRLRIGQINVDITLGKPASSFTHLMRAVSQFENFCTVASSIRQGIPIHVRVIDSEGAVITA